MTPADPVRPMPPVDLSRLLLDPPSAGALLCELIPAWRGLDPARLVVHQSRRRISRKTVEQGAAYLGVAYAWPEDDDSAAPWAMLRAYSRGASAPAATQERGLHLPQIDAVAWLLPHDPGLAALPRFLHGDGAQAPARIVRYEPESHCTARFDWDGTAGVQHAYGKCDRADRWQTTARVLMTLWPQGRTHADAFVAPRPLLACAERQAVWTQAIDGVALRSALAGSHASAWLWRALRGLRRLQALPTLVDDRLDAPVLLERTLKQARKLERADPTLRPQLAALADTLQRTLPPATGLVNAHGDFHMDQLSCVDERLALFDYDNLALAHPAHDVADFASQLLTDAAWPAPRRRALAAGWLTGALDLWHHRMTRADLDWHLRALLLRKAYSFFVRHGADWPQRVRDALALAHGGLAAIDAADDAIDGHAPDLFHPQADATACPTERTPA